MEAVATAAGDPSSGMIRRWVAAPSPTSPTTSVDTQSALTRRGRSVPVYEAIHHDAAQWVRLWSALLAPIQARSMGRLLEIRMTSQQKFKSSLAWSASICRPERNFSANWCSADMARRVVAGR